MTWKAFGIGYVNLILVMTEFYFLCEHLYDS